MKAMKKNLADLWLLDRLLKNLRGILTVVNQYELDPSQYNVFMEKLLEIFNKIPEKDLEKIKNVKTSNKIEEGID